MPAQAEPMIHSSNRTGRVCPPYTHNARGGREAPGAHKCPSLQEATSHFEPAMRLASPLVCAVGLTWGCLATASTVDSSIEKVQQVGECLRTASDEIAAASLSGAPEEAPQSLEAKLASALECITTAHFVAIELITVDALVGARSELYHSLKKCPLVVAAESSLPLPASASTQPQITSLVDRIKFLLSELKKLVCILEEPNPRALCPAAAKIQIAILRFISPMVGINSILGTPNVDVMRKHLTPSSDAATDQAVSGLRTRLLTMLISEAQERLTGLGREQRESIEALQSHGCKASHSFGHLAQTFSLIPLHVQDLSVLCKHHTLDVLQHKSTEGVPGQLPVDLCFLSFDAALEYFNMRPVTSLLGREALTPERQSQPVVEALGEEVEQILRDSTAIQDLDPQHFPTEGQRRAWYCTSLKRGHLVRRKDLDEQIVDWFDSHFNPCLRTVEKPVVQFLSLLASLDHSLLPQFFAEHRMLSERIVFIYSRLLAGREALYQCTQLSTIHEKGNIYRLITLLFKSAPLFNLIDHLEPALETCLSGYQNLLEHPVHDKADLLTTILNL